MKHYEVMNMENLMLRDGWWDRPNSPTPDDEWDDDDIFEEDEIDDFDY